MYVFIFVVISAIAFNVAGGFTRASGSYVFFYSVLAVILGLVVKAYLGEPADSNLRSPILTMQVFTGGIVAMLLAVLASQKLTPRRAVLGNILKFKDMNNASIGCMVVGLGFFILNSVLPRQIGSVLSAIQQLNRFLPMAAVLATVYTIRKSNGKTGISPLVLVVLGTNLTVGLLSFSKEGIFTPFLCWLVAACSLNLNVKRYQVLAGLFLFYLIFHYLYPYSQYGKGQLSADQTFMQRVELSYDMVSHPNEIREAYLQEIKNLDPTQGVNYFKTSQGFFDRLQMISPDDGLINYTSQGNYEGLESIGIDFANWIPHFLWPNKAGFFGGNLYAREIGGIISEEDYTTGISFSPTGEAYHLSGWFGVFVIAPFVWTLLFTVFDALCGDVRQSPWGLLVIAMFGHIAPEGMIGGAIYIMWYGALGVVIVAFASAYVMPILGTLIVGPEPTGLVKTLRPRTQIARRPLASPEHSAGTETA